MHKLVSLTIVLAAFAFGTAVFAQADRKQDPQAPCVVVAGAVHRPMRFELKRETKLLEALAFAGGPTQRASGTIRLIHTGERCNRDTLVQKKLPDQPLQVTELATPEVLRGIEGAQTYLRAGDVIFVVESDPIYVSGAVVNPRAIYFKQPPSLWDAIAIAGGPQITTKETKVIVFRAGDDGRYRQTLTISFSDLHKHPKRGPVLQANDIVYVGSAGMLAPPLSPPKFDRPPVDAKPPMPLPARTLGIITGS